MRASKFRRKLVPSTRTIKNTTSGSTMPRVGELAGEVRDFLLNSGYKSSMAYTDFAELASPPSSGSAQLVFTTASSGLVTTLRTKLKQKFPQLKRIDDRIVDNLNTGDVQVHLF